MMATLKSIALLNHPAQASLVKHWEEISGSACVYCRDIQSFTESVNENEFTLAFVGWETSAPDQAEEKLLHTKYLLDPKTFIVVLADDNQESSIVSAINAGADRYLHIDAPQKINNALIDAVVRRLTPNDNELEFRPYKLNRMTREVSVNGEQIQLTPGEFRIALHLFENNGQILTRTSLLRDIWGLPDLQYNRRVDTKMSHVRRKMMLDGTHNWSLTFPRGKGYRLEHVKELQKQQNNAPNGKSDTVT